MVGGIGLGGGAITGVEVFSWTNVSLAVVGIIT